MREPQIGPIKNPIPFAISISPMFYSRSEAFDVETTIAIEATALMPEPSPPIICDAKDQKRKALGLSNAVNSYRPNCCTNIRKRPTIIASSRPILCKYMPPKTHAII